MFKKLITVIAFFMMASLVYAGSATVTVQDLGTFARGNTYGLRVLKWSVDCVNYSTGDITGGRLSTSGIDSVTGKIVGQCWVPSTTLPPDDNGDMELRDNNKNNCDVLNGAGDDLPDGADGGDVDYMLKGIVDKSAGGNIIVHDADLSFYGTNFHATNSNCDFDYYLYIQVY